MRARLAGIQQQQEQIERQLKAIIDYLRTQPTSPPQAEKPEPTQLSKYERLKIGRWFLAEHGWNKIAQRLAQDGHNVPHKAEERVLAAASWALSRYQAAWLLEQAQRTTEG